MCHRHNSPSKLGSLSRFRFDASSSRSDANPISACDAEGNQIVGVHERRIDGYFLAQCADVLTPRIVVLPHTPADQVKRPIVEGRRSGTFKFFHHERIPQIQPVTRVARFSHELRLNFECQPVRVPRKFLEAHTPP